jgi:flagellar protein FlgJ
VTGNSAGVYNDFQGIAALKYQARQDQAGSLERVARQFESLFVQMMVKQMRQASFGGGIFDTEQTRQYQDMYDQQLSLHLSESGGLGIGELLVRQLGSQSTPPVGDSTSLQAYRQNPVASALSYASASPLQQTPGDQPAAHKTAETSAPLESPRQFIHSLWSAAQRAANSIGLPPEALLAQAALETGWGGHVMPAGDGGSSHNLFGIKADQSWDGDRVRRITLEYEDGVAVQRREYFRAYESFEDSFQDYVEFLKNNPRYADALANTHDSRAYFDALQQAGYATDPSYAEKIVSVLKGPEMERAIARLKSAESQPL